VRTHPEGKQVVVTEWGETPTEALEKFMRLEPQLMPDPATLGPKDVVLRVKSCAVGWVDLLMSSGQYQHVAQPPYTPGLEFAGEVIWVGSEVTRVKVSDAVLADGMLTGPRSSGGYQRWGGFASR
jgi:NADPH:quinone reductase